MQEARFGAPDVGRIACEQAVQDTHAEDLRWRNADRSIPAQGCEGDVTRAQQKTACGFAPARSRKRRKKSPYLRTASPRTHGNGVSTSTGFGEIFSPSTFS